MGPKACPDLRGLRRLQCKECGYFQLESEGLPRFEGIETGAVP